MAPLSILVTLTLTIIFSLLTTPTTTNSAPNPPIGITIYNLPPSASPKSVVATVKSLKITAVRLLDPNPAIIGAFTNTSISLLLAIPNSLIPSLAGNHRANVVSWLDTHVVPFYPHVNISTIAVGFGPEFIYSNSALSAIRNLHVVLHKQLHLREISVSTSISLSSANNTFSTLFPPSSSTFQPHLRHLLNFLEATNSPILVDIYPYDLYSLPTSLIPLGFALFQDQQHHSNHHLYLYYREDFVTGIRYTNLFALMMGSVRSALKASNHTIPIIVTETGWPSFDNDHHNHQANFHFGQVYLTGLLRYVPYGEPQTSIYIFQLYDGEKGWGILYPNGTSKYNNLVFGPEVSDKFPWWEITLFILFGVTCIMVWVLQGICTGIWNYIAAFFNNLW